MIVCFDIGGTAIKGAHAYTPDDIRTLPRQPTPTGDFDAFVHVLRSVIEQAPEKPVCVALSIAGVIDPDSQTAVVANVPCIHGRHLKADLEAALGLPVLIANDADCFVLAEAGLGAGRGHRVVFGVILGTGVGGGLVIDGQLINHEGGFAGEWGHAPVAATQVGEPPVQLPRFACGCGLKGCIDATCSARGMEKLHAHLHGQTMTSEEIVEAWQAGEAPAALTIGVFVELLAAPLALVANVTGATIMPVGGGLSNAQPLLDALDIAVRQNILRRFDHPLVVKAECRIEPGLIGAALLGLGWKG
jgi:N-acetylglucosamine kinase